MAVNYDPVKAHEYYEQHKKLKGRTSTKGFSKSQKEQAFYVKAQLTEEKKAKNKDLAEKQNATAKAKREEFTNQCNEKVKALRDMLKGMSKEQKAAMKESISAQISSIKESFSAMKKSATAESTANKKAGREANQKDYSAKYQAALTKIRNGKK